MMKILELFKGTGSIGKYFPNEEVISLDIIPSFEPTICCDIMEWDYTTYPRGYFDIIWASPECKIFSMLQYSHIGRKWKDKEDLLKHQKEHSKFIERTLEIIEYLMPTYYFIENPLYSCIWNYVDLTLHQKVDVDYCRFGTIYKKPTRILTNKKLKNVKCICKEKHAFMLGVGKGQISKRQNTTLGDPTNTLEKYHIPPLLLDYLFLTEEDN